jgi:signal peptidase I
MNKEFAVSDRKGLIAVFAGLAMPGMGQIYNGELFKGACFFAIFTMMPLICLRLTMYLPDRFLIWGCGMSVLITLAIYGLCVIGAYRKSSHQGSGYMLKSYNRWYFYLMVWLFCVFFFSGSISQYIQDNIMQLVKIAGRSMEPHVQVGDMVIIDKTGYKKDSPKVNDIIIYRYPDDPSKIYIKRIAGLPGQTLKSEGDYVVPHGHVFVMGDNRAHSDDSRHHGPIPMTEILGKARQIYFSSGPNGIRWERIGKVLP